MKTELIIVGGFLGSGKTTSILSIAKLLVNSGKRVGIVTNDQGSDLVDTNFLRKSGFSVLEVTGGCFCCNFDEFISKIQNLAENEMPDVILAEPVGSCTDLIATIFKPIEIKYMSKVVLRPLSIIVDPKRIKRLMMEENSDFHSEINYLFTKQLEEADIIVLNKIDSIDEKEIKSITSFINQNYETADIISVSAKNQVNIENWVNKIYNLKSTKGNTLNIDYTLYGDAEARLGWLNLTSEIISDREIDINIVIDELMNKLKEEFISENYEIAHLKIYGVSEEDWSKASITTIYESLDYSKKSEKAACKWNLIINARIDAEPEALRKNLEQVLLKTIGDMNIKISDLNIECFKPGKPSPKHRML